MRTYFIVVIIKAGEYEKRVTKLIHAENEDEACTNALTGECHGCIESGTAEWTDNGIADLGWEFHYSIDSCKEVPSEHAKILKTYF